ncbi:MAG: hypothetical protein ACI849_000525 [Patiriisocius sp.]|jgi:hypothetical protein
MKKFAFICLLTTLLACDTSDDPGDLITNCTEEFVFGLSIQVRDANTNNIILQNVSVIAVDGDYTEELDFNFDTFLGAGERAGNYVLTVSAEGYQTQITDPIAVGADECHVITQQRDVLLNLN